MDEAVSHASGPAESGAVALPTATTAAAVRVPSPDRPAEPRHEIWYRHRIRVRLALADLWRSRELITTLAERDLRVRYKQALLGFAWVLITPVLLMVVFTFVFTKFTQIETGGVPYPLFVYVALIPWTFFSNSLNSGGMGLVSNMAIVNRVYCPREVFPVAAMIVAAVDAAVSGLVLAVLFVVEGYAPKVEALYFPVLLLVLIAFTLGVTLAISSALVYLRDLRHALPLLVQLMLFATPVAYGMNVLAKTREQVLVYSALNPLAPVIDGFRRTILYGTAPDWQALGVGAMSSVLFLCFGFWLFKRLETGIADIA